MRRAVLAGLAAAALALAAAAPVPGPGSAAGDAPAADPASADTAAFDAGRASFRALVRGIEIPYRVFLVSALPGEDVLVRVLRPEEGEGADRAAPPTRPGRFRLRAESGGVRSRGPRTWSWTAPERAGTHHRLVIVDTATADSMVLNALVLAPASSIRDGRLDGYRLGTFPTPAYRGLDQYRPPRGYLKLTRELSDLRVSPHFTLGQFPCKRPHRWPKYLPPGPKMLKKLERMLQELNARGIRATGFRVMSGYRSPWYNTHLLGRPRYSRHIYGDAADVFVDEDGDGYMDDLNGDGRITIGDAEVLFRIADAIDREDGGNPLTGGLWKYPRTHTHPPFVHVDTRGFLAR